MGNADRMSRLECLVASPIVKAAVAAGVLGVATSTNARAEMVCGNDFDQDYGTKYTPEGDPTAFFATPAQLVNGLGIRTNGNVNPYAIEKTVDGIDFTNIRPEIEQAITNAGYVLDGRAFAACDYSASRDILLVSDLFQQTMGEGNSYAIEGIVSGEMNVIGLKGRPNACGSIDEATGRYFFPEGDGIINEFSQRRAPELFYENHTEDHVGEVHVNLSAGEMAFGDPNNGNKIFRVTGLNQNYPHPNAVKSQVGNLTGSVLGFYGPAETGAGTVLLTNADGYLQYCVEEPEEPGDTVPPTVVSAEGHMGEEYESRIVDLSTDAQDPTVVDCNDREFQYVLKYDEVVTVNFAECLSDLGRVDLTRDAEVNGLVVTLPGHVSPEMEGNAQLTVVTEDLAGNESSDSYYVEVQCPQPGTEDLKPGDTYNWQGGQVVVDLGVNMHADDDTLNLDENSQEDAWAKFQDTLSFDLVVETDEGDVVVNFDANDSFKYGIVLGSEWGGGLRAANNFAECLVERCLAVEGGQGTFTTLDGAVYGFGSDPTYIPLNTPEGTGTGTGTGDVDPGTGSGTGGGGNVDNGNWENPSDRDGAGCQTTGSTPTGGLALAAMAVAGTTLIGRRRRE